jgi:hypothetical protein
LKDGQWNGVGCQGLGHSRNGRNQRRKAEIQRAPLRVARAGWSRTGDGRKLAEDRDGLKDGPHCVKQLERLILVEGLG